MPLHVQQSLALVGFGLLVGFVGFIFTANLFGVVNEQARQMSRSSWNCRVLDIHRTPEQIKNDSAFKLGRYIVGIGWMLAGLAVIGSGIVRLFLHHS